MSNTEAIAILVGILMPFLITILKQVKFPKWANLLITVIACGAAGVATVWARGDLQWANLAVVTALIFVSAQAVYASYWRSTEVEGKLNDLTSVWK